MMILMHSNNNNDDDDDDDDDTGSKHPFFIPLPDRLPCQQPRERTEP